MPAPGPMRNAHAVTKLPAQDLDRARRFYRDKLGLEPGGRAMRLTFLSGKSTVTFPEGN
jgi:catechol 2,3-dioxygenase-like lactoylglutathione lyase family enzyme